MCEGIIRYNILEKNIILVINSCDIELFDVDEFVGKKYLEINLKFLNGCKFIIYIGIFGFINKVGYIVEFVKLVKKLDLNLCFVVIGDGMEK